MIIINQSRLKRYLNCQRLYGWRHIANLMPPTRRAALEIGIAVHAGLQAFHRSDGNLESALHATRESFDSLAKGPTTLLDRSADSCAEEATELVRQYIRYWDSAGKLWAPLGQEITFKVEVGDGTGIFLAGRADNLTMIERSGLWLIDYKTAGRLDARDLMKYEMDLQITAYIYGLSKHYRTEAARNNEAPPEIQGAIIDLLVKTKIPQFTRESYTRSKDELREFELELIEYGRRIEDQTRRVAEGEDMKVAFPRNPEHCFRYSTCEYRDLCLKDTPTRRMAFIPCERDYVDEMSGSEG